MNNIITYIILGFIAFYITPNHNEDINSPYDGVEKYRLVISQDINLGKGLKVNLNPIWYFGGKWPEQTNTYSITQGWLEMNVEGEVKLINNLSGMVLWKTYHNTYNPENVHCNCTYTNQIGLKYEW